jgi:hypothetical protein
MGNFSVEKSTKKVKKIRTFFSGKQVDKIWEIFQWKKVDKMANPFLPPSTYLFGLFLSDTFHKEH